MVVVVGGGQQGTENESKKLTKKKIPIIKIPNFTTAIRKRPLTVIIIFLINQY